MKDPFIDARPPTWASSWGEDRNGRYAAFTVKAVEHVMRWIPPGTFLMGSPSKEDGRYDDEGPQHEVSLTQGFWLGTTPVTQALWRAVMRTDNNPSQFVDDDRPVENVNCEDIGAFFEQVDTLNSSLQLRLPTEAQWEYACRAGTKGAIYTNYTWGILGENNAPALDAIAWYGGNSGVDWDLSENGIDSSSWPEKQYPHQLAGTRKVGARNRNPWGLYDMLGNVWEWCADGAALDEDTPEAYGRPYDSEPVVDPFLSPQERPGRVVRGGSWYGDARAVRAAYRGARHAGDRVDYLGFRVSRGPAE